MLEIDNYNINDETLDSFIRSMLKNLGLDYKCYMNYDEFRESALKKVKEFLDSIVGRTDINFETLMYRYRCEIGDLLYTIEMYNYDKERFKVQFIGDDAGKSFVSLVYVYTDLHFYILTVL